MANEKIIKDFIKTYLDICLNPNKQEQKLDRGESRTFIVYDEFGPFKNPNEQENEMEMVNTKVFEYCIINFHDDGAPEVVVGPEVIATLGEENPRDAALIRIGRRHADVINEDSEVQIRPFCQ